MEDEVDWIALDEGFEAGLRCGRQQIEVGAN